MRNLSRVLIYISAAAMGIVILPVVVLWVYVKLSERLPSEQRVRDEFATHKVDYVHFVKLLQKDPSALVICQDGKANCFDRNGLPIPEYARLIRKTGAQYVAVAEDGSVEFALAGFGCAICSETWTGILYAPKSLKQTHNVLAPIVVPSLASSMLPQENGMVASGFYAVPIEPNWFAYRYEYQE